MRTKNAEEQMSLFDPDSQSGRMCPAVCRDPAPATMGKLSRSSSELKNRRLMLLDLRPGAGNMLGLCWEYDPPWLGSSGTLNTSACPIKERESSLSQILQDTVPLKYYLSSRACLGILRRSEERGKPLPRVLELALTLQAGIVPPEQIELVFKELWWEVQKAEQPDLFIDAEICEETCDPSDKPFAAGFLPESSSTARTVGYREDCAPTLKAGGKSSAVLCINDQGGQRMSVTADVTGTLRAQEHGHQPLVFENHGVDARYTGPLGVVPTMTASYGTGGNNIPLVAKLDSQSFCDIAAYSASGNGREDCSQKQMFFLRQRLDRFAPGNIASTECARQGKDATDLVMKIDPNRPYAYLIRRLLPAECEALQGFPPHWTDLPGASDSVRFKSLGNSIAVPCVDLLMQGIAAIIKDSSSDRYSLNFEKQHGEAAGAGCPASCGKETQ